MMGNQDNWWQVNNIEQLDTPALIIYPERVLQNIDRLKGLVSSPMLLRPHVKTNKSIDATRLMIMLGISKFKCATITEAEMLGICEAKDVLLAFQPVESKLLRLIKLMDTFPKTSYSCLVDNLQSAEMISEQALAKGLNIPVFIDLNVGMDRTGIPPIAAFDLFVGLMKLRGVKFRGLHVYDGHIRDKDLTDRINHCDQDFKPVEQLRIKIKEQGYPIPLLVAGGSPTFAIHSKRENVECSPGTFIFWDKGYHDTIPEQDFLFAALVLSRVISLPDKTKICIDLGYKSISSENDLQNRVYFLNAPHLKPFSQSEEHMVIEVENGHPYKIGDVFFALPIHICPTVAMYDDACVIKCGALNGKWNITSRGRGISK